MKKIYSFLAVSALFAMTACGGKESTSNDSSSNENDQVNSEVVGQVQNVVETEAEETGLTPPFTIIASWEKLDPANYGYDERKNFKITVNKNGTYNTVETKSTKKHINSPDEGEWVSDEPEETMGKWITRNRVIGENSQKVYVLQTTGGDDFILIPDDGEYIWDSYEVRADFNGTWSDCSNLNMKKAIKVSEVQK
ncbi:MAG: hypothetical protein J1F38_05585 [Muribaculaceae bacterium]|nr:hypothetical protein [Muribaculaceae bacterium]